MRNLAPLLLLAGVTLPVFAAKRVTVVNLEQMLASSWHTSDANIAKQLFELELTERLSEDRLAQLAADLPGPLARQALTAVADASAFLDLPAADIPSIGAPDLAAQRSMLALTMDYARATIPKLPNFFATRDTTRFEDTPLEPPLLYTKTRNDYEPLHEVGRSSATVLYRDGHELVDAGTAKSHHFGPVEHELSTTGVFGPILATVLSDSAKGGVTWSHWEQSSTGLQAVFRYTVPKEASHYTVSFPAPKMPQFAPGYSGNAAAGPADGGAEKTPHVPAYHGEIAVNPADGSILRLTLVAELKPSDPVIKGDLMVEYGPVEIGGKTYICPVKSVALSLQHVIYLTAESAANLGFPQTRVNDVLFKQYHLFRADVRVLTGTSE
jgi:hypothetical protein